MSSVTPNALILSMLCCNVTLGSASHDSWCTGTLLNRITSALWEGMGDVGSARYEPALLSPMPEHKCFELKELSEVHPLHDCVQKFSTLRVKKHSYHPNSLCQITPDEMKYLDIRTLSACCLFFYSSFTWCFRVCVSKYERTISPLRSLCY